MKMLIQFKTCEDLIPFNEHSFESARSLSTAFNTLSPNNWLKRINGLCQ